MAFMNDKDYWLPFSARRQDAWCRYPQGSFQQKARKLHRTSTSSRTQRRSS